MYLGIFCPHCIRKGKPSVPCRLLWRHFPEEFPKIEALGDLKGW